MCRLHINEDAIFVLISTDLTLSTIELILTYRKRFPIEFGFRDTKQYLGFCDYQVQGLTSIEKHLTLSQIAYSLGKLVFCLCEEIRKRTMTLFYIKNPRPNKTFSMERFQEELQSDFDDWAASKGRNLRSNFLGMIFENNRDFQGMVFENNQDLTRNSQKNCKKEDFLDKITYS